MRLFVFSRISRRAWLNVGVLAITLSLLLIVSEFTLRWWFRDITTTSDNNSYFARRWHKTVRTNSYGFRERNFSLAKPQGIYRIAVIGDSITYGQGIQEQDRFSNLIERKLTGQNGNYEVLNFGIPGAESIDHVKILKDRVIGVKPDFVLLQWFTNDVEGHDKRERPRSLRLLPYPLDGLFRRYSALFYVLNQNWMSIQNHLSWNTRSYVDYMLERFKDSSSPFSIAARDSLETFIHICKERYIPVGIVLFTSPYDGGASLDFLTERVLQLCKQEAIRCLDLRSSFVPYRSGEQLFANRLDRHPSPFANGLAAERITDTFRDLWRN